MVFAVCLSTTKDPHDAEDAAQAVFLALATHCKSGAKPIRAVGPWLRKVARRTALNVRRARRRREAREQRHGQLSGANGRADADETPPTESRTAEVDPEELNRLLLEELARLPAAYQLP